MYLGNQKAHRITTGIFFKKDSWNVRLEKQEIQVSFLFSKKKKLQKSQITQYLLNQLEQLQLTQNYENVIHGHSTYNLIEGFTKQDVIPVSANYTWVKSRNNRCGKKLLKPLLMCLIMYGLE